MSGSTPLTLQFPEWREKELKKPTLYWTLNPSCVPYTMTVHGTAYLHFYHIFTTALQMPGQKLLPLEKRGFIKVLCSSVWKPASVAPQSLLNFQGFFKSSVQLLIAWN